ncbi:hypothetical protein H6F51_10285 [Cyanobacteria bacterium FACHB-DQ100]|nr:hypothetical protein [Cyanobacteria bacterium FACHB-DQ100]
MMNAEFREMLDECVKLQIQAEAALKFYKSTSARLRKLEGAIGTRFVPEEVNEATGVASAPYEFETENERISYIVLQHPEPNEHGNTFTIYQSIHTWSRSERIERMIQQAERDLNEGEDSEIPSQP